MALRPSYTPKHSIKTLLRKIDETSKEHIACEDLETSINRGIIRCSALRYLVRPLSIDIVLLLSECAALHYATGKLAVLTPQRRGQPTSKHLLS